MTSKHFRPIAAESDTGVCLPYSIQRPLDEIEYDYAKWHRSQQQHPRRGRPPKGETCKIYPVLTADSAIDLEKKVGHFNEILGPKGVGNRRHSGSQAQMYADLLDAFYKLQERNIRLPRGGSLSKSAVRAGVGDVLKKHRYTSHSVEHLAKDAVERRRLGKVMKNAFARVAGVIDR